MLLKALQTIKQKHFQPQDAKQKCQNLIKPETTNNKAFKKIYRRLKQDIKCHLTAPKIVKHTT